jgi:hypothetical protein
MTMTTHNPRHNSDNALTAVEAAEATLAKLTSKKADVIARANEIDKERRAIGFVVHSEGDKEARKQLDALNRETITIDGELVSLEAAISEGQRRLEVAQADLAMKETFDTARRIKKNFVSLNKLAQQADEHLAAFGMIVGQMKTTIDELHSMGQASPTHQQFMTYGAMATGATLMFLPWQRVAEYRHLSPGERRNFTALFKGWSDGAMRLIEARVGTINGGDRPGPKVELPPPPPPDPKAEARAAATPGSKTWAEQRQREQTTIMPEPGTKAWFALQKEKAV